MGGKTSVPEKILSEQDLKVFVDKYLILDDDSHMSYIELESAMYIFVWNKGNPAFRTMSLRDIYNGLHSCISELLCTQSLTKEGYTHTFPNHIVKNIYICGARLKRFPRQKDFVDRV